ncbi:hypothetical protein L0Y69_03445 [bacterium]|nr:hypothetical protein [bacterium]
MRRILISLVILVVGALGLWEYFGWQLPLLGKPPGIANWAAGILTDGEAKEVGEKTEEAFSFIPIFFQASAAVFVWVILMGFIYVPALKDRFKDKPDQKVPDIGPELTDVKPGQAILVARGGPIVNVLINSDGWLPADCAGRILVDRVPFSDLVGVPRWSVVPLRVKGYLDPESEQYKKLEPLVVENQLKAQKISYREIHPLGNLAGAFSLMKIGGKCYPELRYLSLLWVWKKWIQFTTGLNFTGFQRWQGIEPYELPKLAEVGQVFIEEKRASDHVRIRPFIWNVPVEVTISGGVKLHLVFALTLRSFNPELTRYGTDEWWSQTRNMVQNCVISAAMRLPPELVIAFILEDQLKKAANVATDNDWEHILVGVIKGRIPKDLKAYGLECDDVDYKGLRDPLSEEQLRILMERWRAREEASAKLTLDGQTEAEILGLKLDKLKDSGALGTKVLETEAQVETAEKGKATYIVGGGIGGSGTDIGALFAKIDELVNALGGSQQSTKQKGGKK